MLISFAVYTIKSVFKSAQKKAQLRDIMLELYNAIAFAYADDPQFQQRHCESYQPGGKDARHTADKTPLCKEKR